MTAYAEVSHSLAGSLKLTQPPIAVSLTETLPPGVQFWSGVSPAGCRF